MGWSVDEFYLSFDSETGYHHLSARTSGTSKAEALAGAQHIYGLYDGKRRFVRKLPEAVSEFSIDADAMQHRGFVRFSFRYEDGGTVLPNDWGGEPLVVGFGAKVLNG